MKSTSSESVFEKKKNVRKNEPLQRVRSMRNAPQSLLQVPQSFSQSDDLPYSFFQGWVKKGSSGSRMDFTNKFMVYHFSNRLDFFNREQDVDTKAPMCQYVLDYGGQFTIHNEKKNELHLFVYPLLEDQTESKLEKIVIRLINPLDFEEIVGVLKGNRVTEVQKIKSGGSETTKKGKSGTDLDALVEMATNAEEQRKKRMKKRRRRRSSRGVEVEEEEEYDDNVELEDPESAELPSTIQRIEDWSKEDFLEYLKENYILQTNYQYTLFQLGEKYLTSKHFQVNGKQLKSWSLEQTSRFFSTNFRLENVNYENPASVGIEKLKISKYQLKRIARSFHRLVKLGVYEATEMRVRRKVYRLLQRERSRNGGRNSDPSIDEMKKVVDSFSREEDIRDKILSLMYAKNPVSPYLKPVDSTSSSSSSGSSGDLVKKKMKKIFSVKVNIVENLHDDRLKQYRKLLGGFLQIKEIVSNTSNLLKPRSKQHLPVEDLRRTRLSSSNIKNIQSNIKDKRHSSTEFGIFHTSLSIGNIQIEWVDSSLVLIRPVNSEKAILSCDVAKIKIKNGMKFASRLAEEILRWNVHYSYTNYNLTKSNKTEANCQHFALRILNFLQIDWKLAPSVKKYLKNMKYSGVCEKVFKFSKKFADTFCKFDYFKEFKKKEFKPYSHRELDEFVQECFKKYPNFQRDFNNDYMLLKGFDRAFWLQYKSALAKNDDVRRFKPAKRKGGWDDKNPMNWRHNGCPFTRPLRGEVVRTLSPAAASIDDFSKKKE